MRHQHHQIDDDAIWEVLADGSRVLKDGATYVVPMQFADGAMRDLRITDASGSVAGLHKPGFRIVSKSDAQRISDARAAAYEEYRRELCDAWRYDSDGVLGEGKEVGLACTVRNHKYRAHFGEPGHLVEEDGEIVCRPDSLDQRARRDGLTLDELQLDHQRRMQAEYAAYDARVSGQWRTPC